MEEIVVYMDNTIAGRIELYKKRDGRLVFQPTYFMWALLTARPTTL